MSRPDGRLVEVELVEDDADEAGAPAPARTVRSRLAAVPRRVWVSAAVLAAAGAVTVGTVQGVERAAVSARLSATDGLSASLDRPLVEAWRTDGGTAIGVADGSVLVQGTSRLGGESVTAVDAETGDVRWTQPGRCQPAVAVADGADFFAAASRVPELGTDDVLTCVHDGGDRSPGGPAGTVTTHDPATGEPAHTITLDAVGTHTTATLGTDLIAVGTQEDGRVRAGRWSLQTGQRLWDYRSTDTPAADLAQGLGVGFSVNADEVLVQVGSWEVDLDPATGVPREGPDAVTTRTFPWGPVLLPDGATATGVFEPDGLPRIVVEDADGSTRFTTDGVLLPPPAVDDGTGPPTVLAMDVENGGIIALDPGDGRERWRSEVPVGDRAVLSGLLVVTDGSSTTALDARTGEPRWESDTRLTTSWAMITDGRHVLTMEAADAGAVLVARDVDTGEPVWTSDSPVGSGDLRLLPDGTVLATGASDMVALRPAR